MYMRTLAHMPVGAYEGQKRVSATLPLDLHAVLNSVMRALIPLRHLSRPKIVHKYTKLYLYIIFVHFFKKSQMTRLERWTSG